MTWATVAGFASAELADTTEPAIHSSPARTSTAPLATLAMSLPLRVRCQAADWIGRLSLIAEGEKPAEVKVVALMFLPS
jgi:hypothetical protein